jgi:ribosomal protein S18 acetylase RimI-like enzyme
MRLNKVWHYIMTNQDRYRYVIVEENGRILSTCNIVIVPNLTRAARPYSVIENVITHPEARRRGFGRAVDYTHSL